MPSWGGNLESHQVPPGPLPEASSGLTLNLHPKQGRAFLSEKKITLCCSGISGGKSSVGALWIIRQISKWNGGENNYIIGGPTYKIMHQSTVPAFMRYAASLGTYKQSQQEFHLNNGGVIYFRTSTDPYSMEGIQNVRASWLDEAGLCSYSFWINLEGRCARTNAPIICTTTPYGVNWPYQHLIKPVKENKRPDVAYYEWLSIDNPSFPRAEYDRQKQIMDPKTFRRKYMGISEKLEGLVYEITSDNHTPSMKLPAGTRIFAAVDWGFAEGHEFAILVRAVTLDGFRYEIDEFKSAGLDPNQQIQACTSKMKIWGIERFFCDPARPDMIAMLNKAGGKAAGFHEGRENHKPILPGITEHTSLIRSGKYKIWTDKCKHLLDEYETYHWPEFQDGKEAKEVPVAINDHLLDCARYLTVGTMNVVVREPYKNFIGGKRPTLDQWSPTRKSKRSGSWDS